MAPVRPKKCDSGPAATMQSVATPHRSPIKQRKQNVVSAQQKQALIDNLQLEITERARRMRAQYNLQAQGLRSRIEIRINRIPMPLRKLKMEDLLLKYAEREQRPATRHPPPVPYKDAATHRSPQKALPPVTRVQRAIRGAKRASTEISGDKENEIEDMENPKKRTRGVQATDGPPVRPAQILSPTSSNSRLQMNRERPTSPAKSQIARPASPLKNTAAPTRSATASKMLSSFVEKAKSARGGGTRKVTTTSTTSNSTVGTAAPTRTRRAPTTTASRATASRPATRMGRRLSMTSEMSEASNATVVRKTVATKTTNPSTRRKPVAAATSKGTASSDAKKTAPKTTTTTSTTRTGRVLRSRA